MVHSLRWTWSNLRKTLMHTHYTFWYQRMRSRISDSLTTAVSSLSSCHRWSDRDNKIVSGTWQSSLIIDYVRLAERFNVIIIDISLIYFSTHKPFSKETKKRFAHHWNAANFRDDDGERPLFLDYLRPYLNKSQACFAFVARY